jgi:hypothetical protein
LKKSTSFGELFEKTVGNDQTLLNVEVECSLSDGKSTNPVIVKLSNNLKFLHVQLPKSMLLCTEKEENKSFIKVGEIRGQKQNGAQEDKYQQRTTSHKKLNKNIEQQHRPLQKLGELTCFRKVSSSCFLYNTRHVVHRQRHVYRIQWFPYKQF